MIPKCIIAILLATSVGASGATGSLYLWADVGPVGTIDIQSH